MVSGFLLATALVLMAVIPKCEIIDITSDDEDVALEIKLETIDHNPNIDGNEPDLEVEVFDIASDDKDQTPIIAGPIARFATPEADFPFRVL
jgi:hypothetical protein